MHATPGSIAVGSLVGVMWLGRLAVVSGGAGFD